MQFRHSRRVICSVVFLSLTCTPLIFSQEAQSNIEEQKEQALTLTIDNAVDLAVKNNISLKQSKVNLDASKRAYNHSWNSISPSLSVSDSFSTSNSTFGEQFSNTFTARVSMNLSASLASQIKAAKTSYENGLLSYDDAVRKIEMSVRISFYSLLLEKEEIKLMEASVETARKQYNQTASMYRMGSISQLDVLSSQVNYEQSKPKLEARQITYTNDIAVFKNTLGIPQDKEIILDGTLDTDYSKIEINPQYKVEEIPGLLIAKGKLELAKANLLNSRLSNWTPAISAGWSYSPTYSSSTGATRDTGSLSLSVTLPIDAYLPWTKTADAIAAYKDQVKLAELDLQQKIQDADIEIKTALNQIKKSQNTLTALDANVNLAQRSYNMTSVAYSRGGKDYLSLVNSQYSLETAKNNLYAERFNLLSAILKLEYTLGLPFGSLIQNTEISENGESK
ncbi:MAG: TolC family protein [Treponema sp.]|nr:TolC family protein [Treponema sp.]